MIIKVTGNQTDFNPSMLQKTKGYVKNKLGVENIKIIDTIDDNISKLSVFYPYNTTAIIIYDVAFMSTSLQKVFSDIIKNIPDNVYVLMLIDKREDNADRNPLLKCADKEIDIDSEV